MITYPILRSERKFYFYENKIKGLRDGWKLKLWIKNNTTIQKKQEGGKPPLVERLEKDVKGVRTYWVITTWYQIFMAKHTN